MIMEPFASHVIFLTIGTLLLKLVVNAKMVQFTILHNKYAKLALLIPQFNIMVFATHVLQALTTFLNKEYAWDVLWDTSTTALSKYVFQLKHRSIFVLQARHF